MKNGLQAILFLLLAILTTTACQTVASSTTPYGGVIRIGHNAPFTGPIPLVALSGRDTIAMWLEEHNNQIELDGKIYRIEVIEEDNQASPERAARATEALITTQNVLAIIGPYASAQAIPAGEVANRLQTPLISPWSTNPNTTLNRPYVFRIPFLDDFQAQVIAYFLAEEQHVKNVAVLYSQQSDYSRDLARFFREEAEALGMTVVHDESFDADNLVNITPHLERLIQTNAEVLFLPQYYNEVPIIVNQLAQLGWQGRIIGSDTWASSELLTACNVNCEGFYFTTHWTPSNTSEPAQRFLQLYNAYYNRLPDDIAALTWDTMEVLALGLQQCGKLTGNLEEDRTCLRQGLASIEEFEGVTGQMRFNEQGDPIKCVLLVRIEGQTAQFYKQVCPR